MPLLLALLAPYVLAQLPLPTYPQCGEQDRQDLCPSDLDQDWWQISYIPAGSRGTVRPEELAIGSGNRNDRAWRISTGRWDALLAAGDSGFDFPRDRTRNKFYLNRDELPQPQHADGGLVEDWDLDGNGLFNVQDYAEDARVDLASGRDSGDGVLDVSDLLATFSDGVDADFNGFVDDISGWDFFGNDNDATHDYDDGFGTHGVGVIEDMAAEGGDEEDGAVGVCPNCAILPLRIGDTFVTDGNRAALATHYAISRGAVALSLASGALTNPASMTEAAAYARQHGMNIVGAAGDENAYHANFPAIADGALFVKSIRANTDDENNGVDSYLNFFNCNNYGPRSVLSADSPACATGATAITTGAVGLVRSAARDNGMELSSDEVYQLLVTTATDIHLSAEDVASLTTYPSSEGWDPFYGYGRVDIGAAVEAAAAGRIPPMLDLTSPGWLRTLDPALGTIEITGRLSAPRASSFDWTLEVGTGDTPNDWRELARGSSSQAIDGVLGTLDLGTLPGEAPGEAPTDETIVQRVQRVFAPAVTLRLRATDDRGVRADYQETFFVRADPDLLPGFPLAMPGSGESSPVLADMNNDGIFEIVIADSSGNVHAYDSTGTDIEGWPASTLPAPAWRDEQTLPGVAPLREGIIATVAVGDLDGDGTNEVVAGGQNGNVYAWHQDGSTVAGFPVQTERPAVFDRTHVWDQGIAGAPTLYDLDGDGALEVLVAGLDQQLYVWDAGGAPWGPYPVAVCAPELCDIAGARIINSPTVGDVDGDGDIEIALGTNEAVNGGNSSISYLLDATTGLAEPGWPLRESGLINEAGLLPVVGEGHPGSMAFADLDGDGDLEVASPIMLGQSPIYHHDGTVALELPYFLGGYGAGHNTTQPSFVQMTNNPSFGDMTGDGIPDYVIGGAGAYYLIALPLVSAIEWQNVVGAWDGATGAMLPGWPRQIEDLQFLVAPAIADITGDGAAEAVMGSAGYLLHAWDKDGTEADGWPKFTGNWILGSPAVGDIDGDGLLEVVVSTREGNLFAWHTQGRADQSIGWAGVHHDPQNTGNHETPLAVQAGPEDVVGEGGCCDDDAGKGAAGALVLLPLGFLARKRRRG